MLDVMYDIPSNDKINKVVVTKASILGKESPRLLKVKEKRKPIKTKRISR